MTVSPEASPYEKCINAILLFGIWLCVFDYRNDNLDTERPSLTEGFWLCFRRTSSGACRGLIIRITNFDNIDYHSPNKRGETNYTTSNACWWHRLVDPIQNTCEHMMGRQLERPVKSCFWPFGFWTFLQTFFAVDSTYVKLALLNRVSITMIVTLNLRHYTRLLLQISFFSIMYKC